MLSEHVAGVLDHKKQVALLLHAVSTELNQRAIEHDNSKFSPEELEAFEEATPRLKTLTYGSDEYKAELRKMKYAIQHHYQQNRHHPEYFEFESDHTNGINQMNLIDLLEMVCDWIAATKRVKDGDIYKSLPINKERFHISDQLFGIIRNTIDALLAQERSNNHGNPENNIHRRSGQVGHTTKSI